MDEHDRTPSAPEPEPRLVVPPVVFSSPGAFDDPEPMPARTNNRRPSTTARRRNG